MNPKRRNVTQFILSGNCSTCFGCYHHPSSGAQTTVSTSGICHAITAVCCYRGRVGTGLSVLWVAYATHSTLSCTAGNKILYSGTYYVFSSVSNLLHFTFRANTFEVEPRFLEYLCTPALRLHKF